MKTNIVLIGFMGSGKSVVGKALAEKLGREFVEMDQLIEEKAGKSIPDIFREDGEITFRELEIEVTREVAGGTKLVIACGGGIVLNWINIDRLRQSSRLFYLGVSPATVLARTSQEQGQRPLLDVPDPAARVRELLRFRRPFYRRAADSVVDTSRRNVDQVVDLIIRRLKRDEGFNL